MGITFFTFAGLFTPFQRLMDWLTQPPVSARVTSRSVHAPWRPTPRTRARSHGHARADVSRPAVNRPLRVVRVMEPSQAPRTGGRMIISGRMADVCAELDRLAALEAASH